MAKVAIVYHTQKGHTASLAKAVAEGAASIEGVQVKLIQVQDIKDNWKTLEEAEAIIFGCPTYMGSISAAFKSFMEESIAVWFKQGWKDKVAAAFTNSSSQSGDKLNTLFDLSIFAMQHGMIWVGLDLMPGNNTTQGSRTDLNRLGSWLGAMSQSNFDQEADREPNSGDLQTGAHLGKRVALATLRWSTGKH